VFLFLLSKEPVSVAAPVCNALTFVFTAITGYFIGEEVHALLNTSCCIEYCSTPCIFLVMYLFRYLSEYSIYSLGPISSLAAGGNRAGPYRRLSVL
jgi:hypothetical protein